MVIDKKSEVCRLLGLAAKRYQEQLVNSDVIAYLANRGVGGKIAKAYGLGYANDEWHQLSDLLQEFRTDIIEESGLVVSKGGRRAFDRFRSRVMFPIKHPDGQVIGFGGRIIEGCDAKYLNSPESSLFKKGEILYGMYEAQEAITRQNLAIVVEGYLDVITLAQAGLTIAVAPMGTACTSLQINALLEKTSRIVFCFDGDAAGRAAAHRALQTILPEVRDDREIRFLFLPADHDPDSYVRTYGIASFKSLLRNSALLIRYLLDFLSDKHDLETCEGRSACAMQIGTLWSELPDGSVKDRILAFAIKRTNFSRDELYSVWAK